jgi:alpha-2-macroglobulin-like protein
MINDARSKLQDGYKRLISFETQSGGYEWFGQAPGHEALTGYGLLQFTEIKEVTPSGTVSDDMIQRVSEWLKSRRDGEGGFKVNEKSLDTFGYANMNVTNAYLVWVLSSLGYTDLNQEFKSLAAFLTSNDDPYILSLFALTL